MRIHQRRRVQAIHGYGIVGEFCRQVEGERDQCELAAIVGPRTCVVVIHTQICKAYRCLSGGCHNDDPRRFTVFQTGNESSSQERRGEVIDGEPQLVAVCAQDALAVRGSAGA